MRLAEAIVVSFVSTAVMACSSPSSDAGELEPSVGAPVGSVPAAQSPPASGSAGNGATAVQPPASSPSAPGPTPSETTQPGQPPDPTTPTDPVQVPAQDPGLALDECGLDTGFPGDEYCILPPPPEQGFQIHIGPTDYANPGRYLMQPGQESTEDFPAVSGNDTQIYFYYRQYRMRPGSHHLIVSQTSGGLGGAAGGRRLGGSQNLAKDNPDRGIIAPENAGVGMPLDPHVPINAQMHYINTTQAPVLREVWVNFWYKDPATVTEQAREMFANGGLGMNIPAGTKTVLGPYSCPITQAGRVLTLYGHRHANAPRFSAWLRRGGQRQLVYESLDWAEPMVLEFNTITTNTPPDPAKGIQGGHTGILELQAGDALEWECEVNNMNDFALRFGNQTYESEMCILIGDTVGPAVACQIF